MSECCTVRRRLRTEAGDADRLLRDFLSRRCPELPAGFLNRLIRKGFATVDNVVGKMDDRLQPGQRVFLRLPEGSFLVAPNADIQFAVVYEDKDLVVVEKPAGLVSEPGIGHKLDTLLNGLVARYGEALDKLGPECDYGMVHRLDKETSGLMVVTRRAGVQRALSRAFRSRKVDKRYAALVAGKVKNEKGVIQFKLGRVRRSGRAVAVVGSAGNRRAETRYRVLRRYEEATLVEARPCTGRWRQIRLHFAALGHPVAGDTEEGDADVNEIFAKKHTLKRMFLHAARLKFLHPESGKPLDFKSELPAELQQILKRLPQK